VLADAPRLSIVLACAALLACQEPPPGARVPSATLVPGAVTAAPAPVAPRAPASILTPTPVPQAPTVDAERTRAAWLAGPLTGRDNAMARHREARITARADGGYELFVKNQFEFRCALTFGPDGRPALFERCRSGQPGWRASPASIPVSCVVVATEERCEGPFRLLYPSGGGSTAALRIVRNLAP
jgi:hypothetical protein